MNPLIQFYAGTHPDSKGRFLVDILEQDNDWLEDTHDYIQWLFPNTDRSLVTPDAPTITSEVESEFKNNEILRRQLKLSFHRILEFYGLEVSNKTIVKSSNWEARKLDWFIHDTHNNLRITRILKCLCSLGLTDEAQSFYKALMMLVNTETDCGIGTISQYYWAEAVERAV